MRPEPESIQPPRHRTALTGCQPRRLTCWRQVPAAEAAWRGAPPKAWRRNPRRAAAQARRCRKWRPGLQGRRSRQSRWGKGPCPCRTCASRPRHRPQHPWRNSPTPGCPGSRFHGKGRHAPSRQSPISPSVPSERALHSAARLPRRPPRAAPWRPPHSRSPSRQSQRHLQTRSRPQRRTRQHRHRLGGKPRESDLPGCCPLRSGGGACAPADQPRRRETCSFAAPAAAKQSARPWSPNVPGPRIPRCTHPIQTEGAPQCHAQQAQWRAPLPASPGQPRPALLPPPTNSRTLRRSSEAPARAQPPTGTPGAPISPENLPKMPLRPLPARPPPTGPRMRWPSLPCVPYPSEGLFPGTHRGNSSGELRPTNDCPKQQRSREARVFPGLS
mmetsp:Transcript_158408/g.384730  ORF Transcript_158408/g.384730 Transcript_158408/m.384730 type:complete len:386 (-) Transcript_158408:256-1413(-)